jgi:hypothetical protein
MATEPLRTYRAPAHSIEAHIFIAARSGYSVVIFDTDACEYVPAARIYRTLDEAIIYARRCTGLLS